MSRFEIEFVPDEASFERLEDAIGTAAEELVGEVAYRTAETARRIHGYTTRTGNMERNTYESSPRGDLFNETLEAAAIGNTPYASRLENGYGRQFAFLLPAWRLVEPQLSTLSEQIFARRLGAAGE